MKRSWIVVRALACSSLIHLAGGALPAAASENNHLKSIKYFVIDEWQSNSGSSNFEERWNGDSTPFAPVILHDSNSVHEETQGKVNNKQIDYALTSKKAPFVLKPDAPSAEVSSCGVSDFSPDEAERIVREAARVERVDEELAAAVAWTESRFDQDRNSPAGARGVMQLMPATAERFGVADVCDTRQNAAGGVKYLRVLLEQFSNPLLAIAAYNSGEGRIYEFGGIPPFQETISYVSKVYNRQLGIANIKPRPARLSPTKPNPVADADGTTTGVIPVKKNGKFVAGIMHF